MSGNHPKTDQPAADPFTEFWTKSMEQTGAAFSGFQEFSDPQKMQQRWLEAMSEGFEKFLRSPAFCEAMRQNLKATTEIKKAQDQAIEGAARQLGVPLASDVRGLFERLNCVEQAILARLTAVEARLASIESKINKPGKPGNGSGSSDAK